MAPIDEGWVREIFARQESAWNAGDGVAWSASFADDAEFINIRGSVFIGRAEIAARHSAILSSFFRGSRDKTTVQSIKWIASDIALVRVIHDVAGHKSLPPGIRDTESGSLVTRMTCVVKKTGASGGEILFAQNTALANKEDQ